MKGLVWLFFLPALLSAQPPANRSDSDQAVFMVGEQSHVLSQHHPGLEDVYTRLNKKRSHYKRDKDFLAHVFTVTHQRLLKVYVERASYQDLIAQGQYNCLTATSLYALLLSRLGYTYSVMETNYHIFLLVSTTAGDVLLETTDPLNGFIDNPSEIQDRIACYRENRSTVTSTDGQYRFSFSLYRAVTLNELEGLLCYNESIKAYNAQQFDAAIVWLGRAYSQYYSERVDEFSRVVWLGVTETNSLTLTQKASYIRQLQTIRKSRLVYTAGK
jgi:hypothetical protein